MKIKGRNIEFVRNYKDESTAYFLVIIRNFIFAKLNEIKILEKILDFRKILQSEADFRFSKQFRILRDIFWYEEWKVFTEKVMI